MPSADVGDSDEAPLTRARIGSESVDPQPAVVEHPADPPEEDGIVSVMLEKELP